MKNKIVIVVTLLVLLVLSCTLVKRGKQQSRSVTLEEFKDSFGAETPPLIIVPPRHHSRMPTFDLNTFTITNFNITTGYVTLGWQNGTPPFIVQGSPNVSGGPWATVVGPTSNSFESFAVDTNQYWRIASSSPSLPPIELTGVLPGLKAGRDVVKIGNYAYMAATFFGLVAIDVSTPSTPKAAGSSNYTFDGRNIAASGTLICVSGLRTFYNVNHTLTTLSGIYLFSISSNPARPTYLGSIESSSLTFGAMAISSNYLYTVCGADGIRVISLNTPSPAIVGLYDTPGLAMGIAVSGGYAYIADGNALRIFDLNTPTILSPLGSVALTAACVDINGNYAYVGGGNLFQTVEITDKNAPITRGTVAVAGATFQGLKVRTQTVNGVSKVVAFVASYQVGLTVIDANTPTSPSVLVIAPVPQAPSFGASDTLGVSIDGNIAYTANDGRGLGIITVDTSGATATATLTGDFAEWLIANNISVSGTKAAVCGSYNSHGGLSTINSIALASIAASSFPTILGRYDDISYTLNFVGLAFYGSDYLLTACGTAGIKVFHIADPSNITLMGSGYDSPGIAYTIIVSGTLAYLADGNSFRIVDITDPSSLVPKGSIAIPAYAIALTNSLAYVVGGTSFKIIDVTDVNNPSQVGSGITFPSGTTSSQIAISSQGSHLIASIAVNNSGMFLIDVTDPNNLLILPSVPCPPKPSFGASKTAGVAIFGPSAVMSNSDVGVESVNIGIPTSPSVIQYNVLGVGATGVALSNGSLVFASDTLSGLTVFTIR